MLFLLLGFLFEHRLGEGDSARLGHVCGCMVGGVGQQDGASTCDCTGKSAACKIRAMMMMKRTKCCCY